MAVLIGTSRVTVTVRDGVGNLIGGASVVPASNRSGGDFSPGSISTGDDGVATFNFTASTPGAHVISARAKDVQIEQRDTIVVSKLPTSTTGEQAAHGELPGDRDL
ncbi:MAG: Ig-like domain-containing protein [Gemmatimonadetes bacterium]|nr:Ig-like domain-containing protein [Gemmatimonadota bacterium]